MMQDQGSDPGIRELGWGNWHFGIISWHPGCWVNGCWQFRLAALAPCLWPWHPCSPPVAVWTSTFPVSCEYIKDILGRTYYIYKTFPIRECGNMGYLFICLLTLEFYILERVRWGWVSQLTVPVTQPRLHGRSSRKANSLPSPAKTQNKSLKETWHLDMVGGIVAKIVPLLLHRFCWVWEIGCCGRE